MDPNEMMENEPVFDPEAVQPEVFEPVPEEPVSNNTYHGTGAGRKESPFADSPYQTSWEQAGPAFREKAPKQPKPRKKVGKGVKAAILSGVILLGACGATAGLVNARWEKEMDALEEEMEARIEALEKRFSGGTTVISGAPVSSEGYLSPSGVYAMNVNSVVSVGNYATVSAGWGGYAQQQMVSTGSGFIISADGYIISNYHVVSGAERLTVTTYLGDEYEATLVGSDELNDVALLKVEAEGLDAVEIGSSDDLLVGDQVVAIGNPLGELTSTQTVGYVSGKDRAVATDGTIINMIQTDAAINSGNSGGPLFNMKGQVVGITTAKYSGDSASGASIEGIGFAIPIDDVMGMIQDFKDYGYLKNQAYLGVTVRDMDSSVAQMYSLPLGSYVETVTEGGSAAKAGVQPKDIILAVGEYEVGSNAELTQALRKFKAGDTTTITVFRAGQELELAITFDEKPQTLPDPTEETQPTAPQSGESYYGQIPDEFRDFFEGFPFG